MGRQGNRTWETTHPVKVSGGEQSRMPCLGSFMAL